MFLFLAYAAAADRPAPPKASLRLPDAQLEAAQVCVGDGLRVFALATPHSHDVRVIATIDAGPSEEQEGETGLAGLTLAVLPSSTAGARPLDAEIVASGGAFDTRSDLELVDVVTAGPVDTLDPLLGSARRWLVDPTAGVTQETVAAAWQAERVARFVGSPYVDLGLANPALFALLPGWARVGEPLPAAVPTVTAVRGFAARTWTPLRTSLLVTGDLPVDALTAHVKAAFGAQRSACPTPAGPPADPSMPRPNAVDVVTGLPEGHAIEVSWLVPGAWTAEGAESARAATMAYNSLRSALVGTKFEAEANALACDLRLDRTLGVVRCLVRMPPEAKLEKTVTTLLNELRPASDDSGAADSVAGKKLLTLVHHQAVVKAWMHVGLLNPTADATSADVIHAIHEEGVDGIAHFVQVRAAWFPGGNAAFSGRWLTARRAVVRILRQGDVPTPTSRVIPATLPAPAALDGAPVGLPGLGEVVTQALPNGLRVIAGRRWSPGLAALVLVSPGGPAVEPEVGLTTLAPVSFEPQVREDGVDLVVFQAANGIFDQMTPDAAWLERTWTFPDVALDAAAWFARATATERKPSPLDVPLTDGFLQAHLKTDIFEPDAVVERVARETLAAGHPIGVDAWVAARRSLDTVNRRELLRWLKATGRPDRSAVVLAGPTEPARALATAATAFGGWKAEDAAMPAPRAHAPIVATPATVVLDLPFHIAEVAVGCTLRPVDTATVEIAATVLHRRVRGGDAARSALGATWGTRYATLEGEAAFALVHGFVPADAAGAAVASLRATLTALAGAGLDDVEVRGALVAWSAARREAARTPDGFAHRLALELGPQGDLAGVSALEARVARLDAAAIRAVLAPCAQATVAVVGGPKAQLVPALAGATPAPTEFDWRKEAKRRGWAW